MMRRIPSNTYDISETILYSSSIVDKKSFSLLNAVMNAG
jgi:hypothetical protein